MARGQSTVSIKVECVSLKKPPRGDMASTESGARVRSNGAGTVFSTRGFH